MSSQDEILRFPRGCMGVQPSLVKTPCALGCDVRPGSYDVVIADCVRIAPDQTAARILFYGKVPDEKYVIHLAKQYPVRCGMADSRPDSTIVARMVEKMRRMRKQFWRAQYSPNSASIEMTLNEKENLATLHRTMALDEVFFRCNNASGLALPENFREICAGQFASELCHPTRVPVIQRGEETWEWTKGDDHAFHAIAYMLVAMKLGKMAMATSDVVTTIRGAVAGTISGATEEEDDVDPFAPAGESSEQDGHLVWGHDAGL